MTAQRLRVLASVHREHLPEQGGCRPVCQQSGELRPQPIQLRSRAGARRPLHACPSRAAASTAEAGQPDRDLAEQRGNRVLAIVLHAVNALATPAPRPPHGVVPGLRGDHLPLDARQHQLRFGQGQTQIGDVDEAIGPANLHHVRARSLAFRPDFHQPQNPSHVSTLGQRTSAEIPDRRRTPNLATAPLAAATRSHQPFRAVPLRPGPDAPGLTRVFRPMWPCPLSGLAIRMTSVLCSSPSAPMPTSLTIQATLPLPRREYRPENTSSGLAPPISRQSPRRLASYTAQLVTRCRCFGMRCRWSQLTLNGMAGALLRSRARPHPAYPRRSIQATRATTWNTRRRKQALVI